MKEKQHLEFNLLLQDESFIEKVRIDSDESKKYLDKLISKYPDKKEDILFAVQFVRSGQNDRKKLSRHESAQIWGNIKKNQRKINSVSSKKNSSFRTLYRVAASVAVVFILGYFLYQNYTASQFKQFAVGVPGNNGVIILSDGSQVELGQNNSAVEYQDDGQEIFIKESEESTEKIENPKDGKGIELNQVVVPYGRRHSVTLSDGTNVYLNSGSKLIFPAKFSGNKREVFLSGEGFFDVAKDKDKPFLLNTNYVNIKVLGTQFNVSAYDDEDVASTVLVEGSVEVSHKAKMFNHSNYNLKPGQGCFYDRNTNEANINDVNVMHYIGWKDGWIQFRNQPLSNIIKKVEKYYNKTIIIEEEELSNTLISGKLVLSEQFEDALAYLSKTLKGNYRQIEDDKYILKE